MSQVAGNDGQTQGHKRMESGCEEYDFQARVQIEICLSTKKIDEYKYKYSSADIFCQI